LKQGIGQPGGPEQSLPGSGKSVSGACRYRAADYLFRRTDLEIEGKTWLNAGRLVLAGQGRDQSGTMIASFTDFTGLQVPIQRGAE
jgi:hypothetical protein